ncbi:BREX-1 system adenine-specific DNA-methyltransferase PglX [Actinoplanes flavus]|uniref:site-specific DNA-methyltransferase (adenine-specific) n=1 Tax=Actinoplanes flavus TaxID=2820290 RepID=A0ABS3UHX9_9ACTN|nr:BREX-1 system adenine-specific DNA-methyltransferase PglX [Actinoplanes flavus]MBO3737806.1 BREX-1 system adenine-specific DNA-methyltransferase PglX [Actinoplanes flavus]
MTDVVRLRGLASWARGVLIGAGLAEPAARACFLRVVARRFADVDGVDLPLWPFPGDDGTEAPEPVRLRVAEVLTAEVCRDVEVVGWLYQFFTAGQKDEVFAGFTRNRKAGAAEIPAATRLFTPDWIARYLVENSLGRLWLLNRPSSGLAARMPYLLPLPAGEPSSYAKIAGPEEIRLIDPACGSGHLLTYAFDLLHAIYEEEGYPSAEIPGLILAHNLAGVEIDPAAGALAVFALTMKARSRGFGGPVAPRIHVLEPVSFTPAEVASLGGDAVFWNAFADAGTLGSLIRPGPAPEPVAVPDPGLRRRAERVRAQAEVLSSRYHVVVANPPYLGHGNMDAVLSAFARREYPDSRTGLCAMFLERCADLAVPRAFIAMITMQSWMFLRSYAALRTNLLRDRAIVTMAHLGARAFDAIAGEVVATTAFVLVNVAQPDLVGGFVRLVEERGEAAMSAAFREAVAGRRTVYAATAGRLGRVPGTPIAYWLPEPMLRAFAVGRPLSATGEPRQGLATADNGRFVRLWHEVSASRTGFGMSRAEAAASGRTWFPYNKGGDFRRWYGNQEFVVNWRDDGAEIRSFGAGPGRPRSRAQNTAYYFRPSLSWSKVGTGPPAFRWYPPGFVFDVAGTSIFAAERELLRLAAVCNSTVARDMLAATSPTLNFEVGTLARLPVADVPERALADVRELVDLHRADWDSRETSWGFTTLDLVAGGPGRVGDAVGAAFARDVAAAARARALETRVNGAVAAAYGLDGTGAEVPLERITLSGNPAFRFGAGLAEAEQRRRYVRERVADLVSYAVGCMFGRYSLDVPGLVLGDQGATLDDYLARVPRPSYRPVAENVLTADEIDVRFREFLRVAFGGEHVGENLRFVTATLGVPDLRGYLGRAFYADHVRRYRRRPVYWLFAGPTASLIYLHRYRPSTVAAVLARTGARDGALSALAARPPEIDLDDGVKANYTRFGTALRPVSGLTPGD